VNYEYIFCAVIFEFPSIPFPISHPSQSIKRNREMVVYTRFFRESEEKRHVTLFFSTLKVIESQRSRLAILLRNTSQKSFNIRVPHLDYCEQDNDNYLVSRESFEILKIWIGRKPTFLIPIVRQKVCHRASENSFRKHSKVSGSLWASCVGH
jgi:hypothetical protein